MTQNNKSHFSTLSKSPWIFSDRQTQKKRIVDLTDKN